MQHFFRGVFMGAADVVPGVSGGTIALLLGVYERLISNIHFCGDTCILFLKGKFLAARKSALRIELWFLAPLLVGVSVSFVGLAQIIEKLLNEYPESMAGFFFGLVLASVVVAASMVRAWKPTQLIWLPCTAITTFLVLGIRAGSVKEPSLLVFFISGAIAICAMILPGISGSFLLLMIGMYGSLIETINNRHLLELLIFSFGALLSLAMSARILNWLLERYRDSLLAILVGLMIGSLRVLWPWPNGVGVISGDESQIVEGSALAWPNAFIDFIWPSLFIVIGFFLVMGIWFMERSK